MEELPHSFSINGEKMLLSAFPTFHIIGGEDRLLGARTYNYLVQLGNVNAAASTTRRSAATASAPASSGLSVAPAPTRAAQYIVPEGPMPNAHVQLAAAESTAAATDEGFEEEGSIDDDEEGQDDSSDGSEPPGLE